MDKAKPVYLDGVDVTKTLQQTVGQLSINDPKSNLTRCYRQLLMVEEHITTKSLNCRFCCFKHTHTAIGLVEEAIQLDGVRRYTTIYMQLLPMLTAIPHLYTDKPSGPTESEYLVILDKVRSARKFLQQVFFIPNVTKTYISPGVATVTSKASVPPTSQYLQKYQ